MEHETSGRCLATITDPHVKGHAMTPYPMMLSTSHASPRLSRLALGAAALALAALAVAGCNTPAHDKDTNASKYNYSYNK